MHIVQLAIVKDIIAKKVCFRNPFVMLTHFIQKKQLGYLSET